MTKRRSWIKCFTTVGNNPVLCGYLCSWLLRGRGGANAGAKWSVILKLLIHCSIIQSVPIFVLSDLCLVSPFNREISVWSDVPNSSFTSHPGQSVHSGNDHDSLFVQHHCTWSIRCHLSVSIWLGVYLLYCLICMCTCDSKVLWASSQDLIWLLSFKTWIFSLSLHLKQRSFLLQVCVLRNGSNSSCCYPLHSYNKVATEERGQSNSGVFLFKLWTKPLWDHEDQWLLEWWN